MLCFFQDFILPIEALFQNCHPLKYSIWEEVFRGPVDECWGDEILVGGDLTLPGEEPGGLDAALGEALHNIG